MRFTKILLLPFLLLAVAGCSSPSTTDKTQPSDSATGAKAPSGTEEIQGGAEEEKEVPMRPEKEIKAIQDAMNKAGKADERYFESERVQKILDAMPETKEVDAGDYEYIRRLSDKDFASLTVKELVYYNSVNAEDPSQICAETVEGAGYRAAIFAELPYDFDDAMLSERQKEEFQANRDSVIWYLLDCHSKSEAPSWSLIYGTIQLDAWECIPLLVNQCKASNPKNDIILTTLHVLMRNAEYKAFTSSGMYDPLYNADKWNASIPMTEANEKAILDLAIKFYNSKGKN